MKNAASRVLIACVVVASQTARAAEEILFEVEVDVGFAGPIKLKDGRLFAVHRHLEGCHSSDGGRTWESAGPLADSTKTPLRKRQKRLLRPHTFIRLQSGALAITYWQGVSSKVAPLAKQACHFVKSVDEGVSWSEPVQVTWPGTPAYPTWMIQTATGRLVLANEYWYPHKSSDSGVGICTAFYSDDEGKTWAESGDSLILRRENAAIFDSIQVPCIAETAAGRLLMFARNEVGRIAYSYSKDGGERWTPAALTDLVSSNSEIWLTRIPATGDLLCVWNQADTGEIGTGFYRARLTSATSKDSGKTWENFRTVATSPGMKELSRIADPKPPAYLKSAGAVPPKDLVAKEGFFMNTFPRVRFIDETAYLVYNHRVYKYPERGTRWKREYNKRRLRAFKIKWFYEPDAGLK